MTLEDDINKLKLKAGQVITQSWFEKLADTLSNISNRLLPEGRIPLSKLPAGEEGKILIAQGENKDPIYADPLCTLVKVGNVDLTPRDWSSDFAKLPEINDKTSSIDTKLDTIINSITSLKSTVDTLLRQNDNSIVVSCRFSYYVEKGYAFRVMRRYSNIAPNNSIVISLENPSSSNKDIVIHNISVNSNSKFYVDIYSEYTINEEGSIITPTNLKIHSNTNSNLIVRENPNYTAQNSIFNTIIFTSKKLFDKSIVLTPNSKLLFVLTNASEENNEMSIDILWFEK